jgi:hypothetical protein
VSRCELAVAARDRFEVVVVEGGRTSEHRFGDADLVAGQASQRALRRGVQRCQAFGELAAGHRLHFREHQIHDVVEQRHFDAAARRHGEEHVRHRPQQALALATRAPAGELEQEFHRSHDVRSLPFEGPRIPPTGGESANGGAEIRLTAVYECGDGGGEPAAASRHGCGHPGPATRFATGSNGPPTMARAARKAPCRGRTSPHRRRHPVTVPCGYQGAPGVAHRRILFGWIRWGGTRRQT